MADAQAPSIVAFTRGAAFRQLRKGLDLNQHELATKADVSRGTITRIENNKPKVNVESLDKVAVALGVTLATIDTLWQSRADVQPQERQRQALAITAGAKPSGSSTTPTAARHPGGTFTEASPMDLVWYVKGALRGNEDLLREWLTGAMALADQIAKRSEGLSREAKGHDP